VVRRNRLRAIGRRRRYGGCRSGERETERENKRACGEEAAKFQHRDVKMTRRDLFDKMRYASASPNSRSAHSGQ
jgi:hypothetical protein